MSTTSPKPRPSRPDERDPNLWHISLDTTPDRAHCGLKLDPSKASAPLDAPGPTCVVCEELSAAYDAGRWTP